MQFDLKTGQAATTKKLVQPTMLGYYPTLPKPPVAVAPKVITSSSAFETFADVQQRQTRLMVWNAMFAKIQEIAGSESYSENTFWRTLLVAYTDTFGPNSFLAFIDAVVECLAAPYPPGSTNIHEKIRSFWQAYIAKEFKHRGSYVSIYDIGIEVGAGIKRIWKKFTPTGMSFARFHELVQACLINTFLIKHSTIGTSLMMQHVDKMLDQKRVLRESSLTESSQSSENVMEAKGTWPQAMVYPPYQPPVSSITGRQIVPPLFKPAATTTAAVQPQPLLFLAPPPSASSSNKFGGHLRLN